MSKVFPTQSDLSSAQPKAGSGIADFIKQVGIYLGTLPQPANLPVNTVNPSTAAEFLPKRLGFASDVPIVRTSEPLINPSTKESLDGQYSSGFNNIVLRSDATPSTVGHEVGHALWSNTLTDAQQKQWTILHKQLLDRYKTTNDPFDIPPAVAEYPNDPSHSFASAVQSYSFSPDYLAVRSKPIYDFIKATLGGYEYAKVSKSK